MDQKLRSSAPKLPPITNLQSHQKLRDPNAATKLIVIVIAIAIAIVIMGMGTAPRAIARSPTYILPSVIALCSLSIVFIIYKVDRNGASFCIVVVLCVICFLCLISLGHFIEQVNYFATQTKSVAGHNLEPTPWHLFPPKTFNHEMLPTRAYKLLQCSYLACRHSNTNNGSESEQLPRRSASSFGAKPQECPAFFRWIHHDLEPWARSKISPAHLEEAKRYAAFRVVIAQGKLYVDLYYACVQSRAMFTIWGLLQMLKRYPGRVPDVDFMFDCMDKPIINRTEHASMPLPLFRYCTNEDHFDIPFPDWSFWGW